MQRSLRAQGSVAIRFSPDSSLTFAGTLFSLGHSDKLLRTCIPDQRPLTLGCFREAGSKRKLES